MICTFDLIVSVFSHVIVFDICRPLAKNPNDELLVIKVWDFDAAEPIARKVSKVLEVKGAKGFRKMVKEVAGNMTSGKQEDEYIGGAKISLKTIPAVGTENWFNIGKKRKSKPQGKIRLKINFSAKKSFQVASQEHRELIKILLHHELESARIEKRRWSENLSELSETLVIQHHAQSELSTVDVAFAQWFVFIQFHQHYPLSFVIFERILLALAQPIKTKNLSHYEELKSFWESTKLLLPSIFNFVRTLHDKANDTNLPKNLPSALRIMAKVIAISTPKINLLPSNLYEWLNSEELKLNLRSILDLAVTIGTEEYFDSIVNYDDMSREDVAGQLQMFSKVLKLVKADLQAAYGTHDKAFKE